MKLPVPDRDGTGFRKIGSHLQGGSTCRRYAAALAIALLVAGTCVVASTGPVLASDSCQTQSNLGQSLPAGGVMKPSQILCSSEDGNHAYNLVFQWDCNLVLYTGGGTPLWSSNTQGGSCNAFNSCVAMQGDGNLVIYYPNGCGNQPARWTSGTGGHPSGNFCLFMQIDGNVTIVGPATPCGSGGSPLSSAHWPTWTQTSNSRGAQGADGWRGSVFLTRNTCPYPCKSTNVYFRARDFYSGREPSYNPWVQNAVNAWNQSPTIYSFTPHANDTYNNIYASYQGDTTYASCGTYLTNDVYAITIAYDQYGNQVTSYEAKPVYWTDVCLNDNTLFTAGEVQSSTAHELGHTLGLGHNLRDTTSVMAPYGTATGPNSNDTGAPSPGCPNRSGGLGGLGGGSMCIYGWGD